jgi:hypothetical protein
LEPVKLNVAHTIIPETARDCGSGSCEPLMHIAAQQSKILFGKPLLAVRNCHRKAIKT